MSWIDYTFFGIIALSMVIGVIRGFVREAISLATWIIAFWVAIQFSTTLGELFATKISTPSVRYFLSFMILFIVTLMLGALINYIVHKLVVKTGLTGTDRFLGVLFGAARGVLLLLVFAVIANWTLLPETDWWEESWTLPKLEGMTDWIIDRLPDSIQDYIEPDEVVSSITVVR